MVPSASKSEIVQAKQAVERLIVFHPALGHGFSHSRAMIIPGAELGLNVSGGSLGAGCGLWFCVWFVARRCQVIVVCCWGETPPPRQLIGSTFPGKSLSPPPFVDPAIDSSLLLVERISDVIEASDTLIVAKELSAVSSQRAAERRQRVFLALKLTVFGAHTAQKEEFEFGHSTQQL
jgi:hypothetical protein